MLLMQVPFVTSICVNICGPQELQPHPAWGLASWVTLAIVHIDPNLLT